MGQEGPGPVWSASWQRGVAVGTGPRSHAPGQGRWRGREGDAAECRRGRRSCAGKHLVTVSRARSRAARDESEGYPRQHIHTEFFPEE